MTWPEDTAKLVEVVGYGAEAEEPAGDAAASHDHHVGLQLAYQGGLALKTNSAPSNQAQSWSSHHWASSIEGEVPAQVVTKGVEEGGHGYSRVHGRGGDHHEVEGAHIHDRQAIHFRASNEALVRVQVEVLGEGPEEEHILHSLQHDWGPKPGQVHSAQPLPFQAAWTDATPRVADLDESAGAHRYW